jgi:pilus assembly protein TadC
MEKGELVVLFRNMFGFFFNDEKIIEFEEKLLMNDNRIKDLNFFIHYSLLFGGIISIIGMLICFYAGFETEKYLICGVVLFFIPFFLNYLFQDILFEKRKRKREELLPEVLLEASVFCDENSLLKTIQKISEQDFELISKDFANALREIKKGAGFEEALERMKKLNKSKEYSRVIDLLLQGYNSGAEMSELFKETAEDLLENKAIIKERQAVMLVTKYTLLLASALIVPAILGLIIGLVSGFNFSSLGAMEFGLSVAEREAMFSLAVLGTNFYIIEYAILSAFFLSLQEGNKKQFWVYCLFILPVTLLTFFFAQTLA